MKHAKKRPPTKLTMADYIKAVKKADREIEQSISPGWTAITKIHPNKKIYNRRLNKRIEE